MRAHRPRGATRAASRRAAVVVRAAGFFEAFDGDSVNAVKDAMEVAKKFKSAECSTEHVLLALTRLRDPTSKALMKSQASEEAVRRAIGDRAGVSELEFMNPFAKTKSVEGLLPLSEELKRCFERANSGGGEVTSKELALAMLDDAQCGAYDVLVTRLGCDVKTLRGEKGEKDKEENLGRVLD